MQKLGRESLDLQLNAVTYAVEMLGTAPAKRVATDIDEEKKPGAVEEAIATKHEDGKEAIATKSEAAKVEIAVTSPKQNPKKRARASARNSRKKMKTAEKEGVDMPNHISQE